MKLIINLFAVVSVAYLSYVGYLNYHPKQVEAKSIEIIDSSVVVPQKELEPKIIAVSLPEPEPVKAIEETQLFLIVKKSIETDEGVIGIRPGTKIDRIGVNRYQTENNIQFIATKDEVTTDKNAAMRSVERYTSPIVSEPANEPSQPYVAEFRNAPVQPREPSANPLDAKSYNRVDFGLKTNGGLRKAFVKH